MGKWGVEMENRFKQSLLDKSTFSVTWELVPGRGAREKAQDVVFASAELAARGGKVHALTITDNPGGNPAISADYLGMEIRKMGIEPLVHFTCKDKNRNQIESELHALARAEVPNLLVMSGDYPVSGYQGRPRPVYDLDPSHVLSLINEMNQGLEVPAPKGTAKIAPTDFFPGAAVSPFKREEAEQVTQYYKLKKKIEAGARFIITQLGYDARKFHEALQFIKLNGWDLPVVGNLYVLPYGAARTMNANLVPGCVVTDELLAALDKERTAADKGKEARLMRAAKMYAFMKGMGFDGVHIGGHGLKYEEVEYIVDKGNELYPNWQEYIREFDYPMKGGFYYFRKDDHTGLNAAEPTDRSGWRPRKTFRYRTFRLLHHTLFNPKNILFRPVQAFASAMDGSALEKPFTAMEHLAKVASNNCQQCGDCALFDMAYLCPLSQCPKNQRNGPCGGSFEGWCEVYPNERKCVWVRAYERLKAYREEETLRDTRIPPVNWDLYHTSSWINFWLGRDHSGPQLGIKPPKKRSEQQAADGGAKGDAAAR